MESLFGRARFSAGINPSLASIDLHWLHGKKWVLYVAERGGQVASVLYCAWQGLAEDLPPREDAPKQHEAAQALVIHKFVLLLYRGLPS